MIFRFVSPFLTTALVLITAVQSARAAEFTRYENFPQAAQDAFSVVGTGLPDGRLLVWDGSTVYRQTAINADAFDPIATGYTGDPGFITMAPDGRYALLGAGFSGDLYRFDTANAEDFDESAVVANINHFDGLYLTQSLVLIDAGVLGEPSELVITDLSANKVRPVPIVQKSARYKTQVVEKPEGSFSATLALAPAVNPTFVLAMDGATGEIRRFRIDQLIDAFTAGTTLDWERDGIALAAEASFRTGGLSGFAADGQLVNPGTGGVNLYTGDLRITPAGGAPLQVGLNEILDPAMSENVFYSVILNQATRTVNIRVGDFTPGTTINGDVYRAEFVADTNGGSGTSNVTAEAQVLLEGFAAADSNGDGELTLAEAQGELNSLTSAEFNVLDSNGSATLSTEELEQQVPEAPVGCALLAGKSALEIREMVADLFLLGLTMVTLAAMGTRWRR